MNNIAPSSIDFIKQLAQNNNKEWFTENKATYQAERTKIIAFADSVLQLLNQHDQIENASGTKCIYRIYRDVRFSKDKTPYKTNWAMYFRRATQLLRGGYYLHIEPNNYLLGVGFWNPESKDLKRIRENLSLFGDEFKTIVAEKNFKNTFGEMYGAQLKTCPKGFDKNDPHIDLLRYKQFLFTQKFTEKEVLSEDFAQKVNQSFQTARPFLNFMSEALTTDSNGEALF